MTKEHHKGLAEHIGKAIASRRIKAGLTQEQVAEKLGVGYEAVSRLERGVATVTVVRLFELAEIFGCETAELLTVSSMKVDDQARHLSKLLGTLKPSDRQLLMDIMQQLGARMANDG
ncbi:MULTISPECIES: helix-turn-helix domain-containing protein [Halopseudomonas]|uniref:Transcriptional regulator, contains XRE-family HTH domain n=2 Tax=Halopseudomonas TaxID=2901189 RepID=A0A1H9ND23_9GAMM|nr:MULTISPECIES: helix-turn-helix transcriptional regulator [Halopseudomonas]SER33876.1 Transcriptional regulator, contains XRE-family HTH domain [Halopseudomonas bauzanensis]SFL81944.1 Transcriptional regulator, contains XRE-family HTH domain [Halopseudomonas bauzanensis]SFQ85857.1 Transcriptional regulator, contains XRE-family HTH domain [Halopseudomonas formosensis]